MLIIVPCSSQKSVITPSRLNADTFHAKTLDEYAQQWVGRVRAAKKTYLPDQVYAGQGITIAREASEHLDAGLHILSAGLSMVSPTQRIPGYDLTVNSGGPGPFNNVNESANAVDWWDSLNRAFGHRAPLARLIKKQDSLVIVALSESYLLMVEPELKKIAKAECKKLRLITSSKTKLSNELAAIAIRYDQRLNTAAGARRGANTTFIQRALLHYSQLLTDNPRTHSVKGQQALVEQSFGDAIIHERPSRLKLADPELLQVIKTLLKKKVLTRASSLELIRHEKGIACEQSRFNRLYDQVLNMRVS